MEINDSSLQPVAKTCTLSIQKSWMNGVGNFTGNAACPSPWAIKSVDRGHVGKQAKGDEQKGDGKDASRDHLRLIICD